MTQTEMTTDWTIAAQVDSCETCGYWHRDQVQYVFGMCRRWPPRAGLTVHAAKAHNYDRIEVTMQTSASPEWPNTGKDDGCGEHKQRVIYKSVEDAIADARL